MRGALANGERIQAARLRRGLTQEQLASLSGIDVKTVRNAEHGKRLDLETITKIGNVLGANTSQLIIDSGDVSSDVQRNVNLFHQWQAAHNRRDVEALLEFYHNSASVLIPGADDLPGGGEFCGRDAIRRQWSEAFAAFEMDEVKPEDFRVNGVGDFIWVRGTSSATMRATGERIAAMAIHELEMRDGLIYRHTIIIDTAGVRRALEGE